MKVAEINETNYMLYEPSIDTYYYRVILLAFVITWVLAEVVASALFNFFLYDVYNKQTFYVKGELKSGISSIIHSIVVTTGCFYCLYTDDVISEDPVWGHSPIVSVDMAIVVGYLTADVIIINTYYSDSKEYKFFMLHHLFSVIAYMYSMTYHVCEFFSNFRLLAEFSTPFVNLRRIFEIMEFKKTGAAYVTNGWAMALSFFLCRIAVIPYYYAKIYQIYGTPLFLSSGFTQYVLIIPSIALDLINVFWFYKIVRGALKVISAQSKEKLQNDKKKA